MPRQPADVREFYRQLFKDQFLYEANAENADGYVRGRMVMELPILMHRKLSAVW